MTTHHLPEPTHTRYPALRTAVRRGHPGGAGEHAHQLFAQVRTDHLGSEGSRAITLSTPKSVTVGRKRPVGDRHLRRLTSVIIGGPIWAEVEWSMVVEFGVTALAL